jgi:hypothetical protein
MRKPWWAAAGVAALALTLPAAVPAAASSVTSHRTSGVASSVTATPDVHAWFAGVRAGTTRIFASGPDATCRPVVGTRESDRWCKVTFSGRFRATDQPYHGTYSGSAFIHYLDPATNNAAAWDRGTVTYRILNPDGSLLAVMPLAVDGGTGGLFGYPFDLVHTYAIEERGDEVTFRVVLRMTGTGINQLDPNLRPIRTFVDRIGYQNGI